MQSGATAGNAEPFWSRFAKPEFYQPAAAMGIGATTLGGLGYYGGRRYADVDQAIQRIKRAKRMALRKSQRRVSSRQDSAEARRRKPKRRVSSRQDSAEARRRKPRRRVSSRQDSAEARRRKPKRRVSSRR